MPREQKAALGPGAGLTLAQQPAPGAAPGRMQAQARVLGRGEGQPHGQPLPLSGQPFSCWDWKKPSEPHEAVQRGGSGLALGSPHLTTHLPAPALWTPHLTTSIHLLGLDAGAWRCPLEPVSNVIFNCQTLSAPWGPPT